MWDRLFAGPSISGVRKPDRLTRCSAERASLAALMLTIVAAGRLLGASLACGLNLYATVAVFGIASRVGWIEALPPAIHGLESTIIIVAAVLLFSAELIASAIPVLEAAWEAVHTIIRPVAAGALAWLVLEAAPTELQVLGVAAAGLVALMAHTAKVGLRLIEARRRMVRFAISAIEDGIAVGLAISTLVWPAIALGVASALFALLVLRGPRLWRAAAYGARAVVARLRGFFGTRDFRDPGEMPAALRGLIATPSLGTATTRAVRATLGRGAWRNGWLVFEGHDTAFLYRGLLGGRRIPLRTTRATMSPGFLADTLDLDTPEQRLTFMLLKDGPPAEATVTAIRVN